MSILGIFPFGEDVRRVEQSDRMPKRVFVLGVYASAVHAKWISARGKEKVRALAVASEPRIFWCGDGSDELIASIRVPPRLGQLEPAEPRFNGPSGCALDSLILEPLGLSRDDAWLSDLVPHSCANPAQLDAIRREYLPHVEDFSLPYPTVPTVPRSLADDQRRKELQQEIREARADVVITLGDEPIRWFLGPLTGKNRRLADFGDTDAIYGRIQWTQLDGRRMAVIPLAHPRQVASLGRSSKKWLQLHDQWRRSVAPLLFKGLENRES